MSSPNSPPPSPSYLIKLIAILALVFGIMTLFSGGSVLFGPERAREVAGAYVPFVVWFNFLAGFFYILAAAGIWLGRNWALELSVIIASATGLAALAFVFQVVQGAPYEMRTIGALVLRIGFWAAIAAALHWTRRPS